MTANPQTLLFPDLQSDTTVSTESSTTFSNNLKLPVHRWFRYSAGFSAEWVQELIRSELSSRAVCVFDPFAGSGTTLLAAESLGVESCGVESHPFVCRIARAKLAYRSCPEAYLAKMRQIRDVAVTLTPAADGYPKLIYKCYSDEALQKLDALRQAVELTSDDTPASELAWLSFVSILRRTSIAGTAQWQYILPRKTKKSPQGVSEAYQLVTRQFHHDMLTAKGLSGPRAEFVQGDARTCEGVPDASANLVITSPPYPNNYDYADATRLEMSFLKEIAGWGDLQSAVRRHLVCSCSQHVPERSVELEEVLAAPELAPIRAELTAVCEQLAEVRKTKGGKKTYHLMIACYFRDLAQVWNTLRRVCRSESTVCFVIGDSAPYGVYVPVIPWFGTLAIASGFCSYDFEQTRLRNVKWKNRKHRVPLQEGRLWVKG